MARLNGVLHGALARESFTLSQCFYFGRVANAPYECIRVGGTPIDMLPALAAGAIDGGPAPKPPGALPHPVGVARADRMPALREQDTVYSQLRARGMVREDRADGAADIVCPFEHEHSTKNGGSSTTYFPKNTGGFQSPAIVCQHGRCRDRRFADYARELGVSLAPAARPISRALGSLLIDADAAMELRDVAWLVRDLIKIGYIGELFGPANVGKTAIALDIAARIATGFSYDGHAVTPGRVIYVAGEGYGGLGRRLRAWSDHPRGQPAARHPDARSGPHVRSGVGRQSDP